MVRVMAGGNVGAELRQPLRNAGGMQVASADREIQAQAQLRNTAHAGAADTHEMEAPLPRQQSFWHRGAHAASRASSRQALAMVAAASGLAARCAACAIC